QACVSARTSWSASWCSTKVGSAKRPWLRSVATKPGQPARKAGFPAARRDDIIPRWLEGAQSACANTDKRGRGLVPPCKRGRPGGCGQNRCPRAKCHKGGSTMKHVTRMALMVGVAVGALWAVSGDRGYTQAVDPNAAPNPYKMQDSWLQLPEGREL